MTENLTTNLETQIEDSGAVNEESESQTISETDTESKPQETRSGVLLLRSWLNKSFRVQMTDGRILIGIFLCTDKEANIILGSCSEYLPVDSKGKTTNEEPRMLGLVMIPGKHIVSLQLVSEYESANQKPITKENAEEVM
ncbi:unnamed protein product [Psylliodes chrysocephalus]|uniref:Sm domain-containing protein n=1 Tax=Psylliodes chrysocephalus TaxID=3402493 RepID=A0A9P0D6N5_9CUCU|nr:unnamed protein product [Psylliodes chrysocephala]